MKPRLSNPANDEAIEALAAAWLAERDDGFSAAQEGEFARWQQADPRHTAAVRRLSGAWGALQQLREFRPEAVRHPDRDLLAGRRKPGRVVPFPALAAAAALAAAITFAAVLWWPRATPAPVENPSPVYATTAGGYQRVSLEDGSVLELNASSKVQVRFTPAERQVRLLAGEVFFTVAKNQARPFIVEAGKVAVRAVGTAFSVRLDARAVEVLVTEGRVKVLNYAAPGAGGAPELAANERMLIPSADQSVAFPAVAQVRPAPPEVIREALAWQGPRLRFSETPLAQVVVEFNRHNQMQIELSDAGLATLPVDGSFRAENLDAFIRLITADGSITAERPDANRIVLNRAR